MVAANPASNALRKLMFFICLPSVSKNWTSFLSAPVFHALSYTRWASPFSNCGYEPRGGLAAERRGAGPALGEAESQRTALAAR
jgi:hypothetical protein